MILEIFFTLLLLILSFCMTYLFKKKIKYKKIIFAGHRQVGKTISINYLLNQNFKTLPTIEPYEVAIDKYLVREQVYKEDEDIPKDCICIFFLKDNKDLKHLNKRFYGHSNIKYVMYKKSKEKLPTINYLDENPKKILSLLQ